MGLRSFLSRILSTKVSDVGNLISLFVEGMAVWTPRRYDKFAEEGYQKNAIAFAAINLICQNVARVPLILYRLRGEKRVELVDHPLITLLKRPNPMQGGVSFMESVCAYYQISGNTYVEGVSPSPGRSPQELYSHRPDRIQVVAGNLGIPSGYKYTVSGQSKTWPVDQISGESPLLHVKSFNPLNDWYGMSPIEAAAASIDIHNKTDEWNMALVQNGARPSGALVYEDDRSKTLDTKAFNKLDKQIKQKYQGAANAGKVLLLEGGLKWQEMGLSPKDMDYIESKRTSARDIALAFNVPPQMLGIPGDNTYSNYQEARQALYEDTILPLLNMFLSEFNNWLVPMFGNDLELAPDEDKIVALAGKRQKQWETIKDANFLTDNEKRNMVGFDDIVGGDTLFKPMNLVPVTTITSSGNDKSVKFLNLRTEEERHAEWLIQMKMLDAFERSLKVAIFQILKKQARKSAEAFKDDGVTGVSISLRNHAVEISQILRASYITTGQAFGERIFDNIPKHIVGGREVKDRDGFFEVGLISWIEANTAAKVAAIAATTRDDIIRAIALGEQDNLTINQIAEKITNETGGVIAETRATSIAVTETHSAAMAANDIAAEATGLQLQRKWLSARDGATRDSHFRADGQLRGMKEFFDVGGAKLLRPGDPAGPPEETINCRCIVDYVTEGA